MGARGGEIRVRLRRQRRRRIPRLRPGAPPAQQQERRPPSGRPRPRGRARQRARPAGQPGARSARRAAPQRASGPWPTSTFGERVPRNTWPKPPLPSRLPVAYTGELDTWTCRAEGAEVERVGCPGRGGRGPACAVSASASAGVGGAQAQPRRGCRRGRGALWVVRRCGLGPGAAGRTSRCLRGPAAAALRCLRRQPSGSGCPIPFHEAAAAAHLGRVHQLLLLVVCGHGAWTCSRRQGRGWGERQRGAPRAGTASERAARPAASCSRNSPCCHCVPRVGRQFVAGRLRVWPPRGAAQLLPIRPEPYWPPPAA